MRLSRAKLGGIVLVAVTASLAVSSAVAYFTTTGSGTVSAAVSSLGKPTIATATPAVGGTVTLNWGAVTPPGAGTVTYSVTRDGLDAGGSCPIASGPTTVITCVDKNVEPGPHTYVVTALWGSWRAVGPSKQATVTIGAPTHFSLAASSTEPLAGAADNLTITALDVNNEKVTTYAGTKNLTFSGAAASPSGNQPTVIGTSAAVNFGTATPISFTLGQAVVSSSKNGVLKVYRAGPANISVTDGTIAASPALAITVATATVSPSKIVLTAETTTPAVGAADDLAISAQDAYGNPVPGYAGPKNLTFAGGSAGPSGTMSTVTNSAGKEVPFGSVTPIEFKEGVATTAGALNGEMRLYRSAANAITVTDGTLTSAAVTVTPSPGAAAKLALTASTLVPVAGASVTLTTTALDTYGNTATGYTGSRNLVYSGATASPAGTVPTVTNAAGTAIAFGATAATTFTVGGSGAKTMKLYRSGTTAISVTDGSLSTETPLTVTVATNATPKLVVAAESLTPTVGAADDLTISEQDTYGNPITSYAGTKSLTFSGAAASGGGNLPTVTNSSGEGIPFGTATPIEFKEGVATTAGALNGEMRLFKNIATVVKVTDGALTSAGLTVTPTTVATNFLFVSSASTLAAGATSNLTLTARDVYANTVTTYAGTKGIFFTGANTSPAGTAPTVSNSSGTAIPFGSETALTFTAGVATVSSTKNGVFKPARAEAAMLTASDGTISSANSPTITVSPTTVTRFGFTHATAGAGTLTAFCYFTCTATGLGNSGTIVAGVAATDAYGNVVSNLGSGHTALVTATAGTVTGGSLPIPATGLAESATDFTFTSPVSGSFSSTVKAAASVGTAYTNALITANK